MNIDLHERPRPASRKRPVRSVTLRQSGVGGGEFAVQIPADMRSPDVIKCRGRIFAKRSDNLYTEATMWPIVEGLDAHS